MKRLLFLFLILSGCKGVETVSSERTVRDSVIIREVEQPVLIPGYSLEGVQFNLDSLAAVLKSGVSREVVEKTLIREDPETKSRVKILIDELGNLTAVCEQQERIIEVLVKEREIYRTETERIIQREKAGLIQQIKNFFKYVLLFFGLIAVSLLIIKFIKIKPL